MKLSKALKLKNRLVGEIGKQKVVLSSHNSVRQGAESEYKVKEVFDRILQLTGNLVNLKTAIALANSGVTPTSEAVQTCNHRRIFEIAEIKGLIEFLQTVPTKHGSFPEGYSANGPTDVTYEAAFREKAVADLVSEFQKQIDSLQDDIDAHNATVDVPVDVNL